MMVPAKSSAQQILCSVRNCPFFSRLMTEINVLRVGNGLKVIYKQLKREIRAIPKGENPLRGGVWRQAPRSVAEAGWVADATIISTLF